MAKRKVVSSERAQRIADVICNGFDGVITNGDIAEVARIANEKESYIRWLINTENLSDNAVYVRYRMRNKRKSLPLNSRSAQIAYLQRMLDDAIDERQRQGRPLTDKDPLLIIDQARRITEPRRPMIQNNTVNNNQPALVDLSQIPDEEIAKAIDVIQRAISTGSLAELVESSLIIDAKPLAIEG